jgi:hypothetical protein
MLAPLKWSENFVYEVILGPCPKLEASKDYLN